METKNIIEFAQFAQTPEEAYYHIEYNGTPIEIKRRLSLTDILQICDDAVSGCFLGDGTFVPEVRHFLAKRSLIQAVTDIALPEDVSECYEFVENSEFGDWIIQKLWEIYDDRLCDIEESIDMKINYFADSGIAAIRSKMSQLIATIDNFANESSRLFGDISAEDRDKLISAVGSLDTIDEDKLVKAFMKQDKKAKAPKAKKAKDIKND